MNISRMIGFFTIIAALSIVSGSFTTIAIADSFTMVTIETSEKILQASKPGVFISIIESTDKQNNIFSMTKTMSVATYGQNQACIDKIELQKNQLMTINEKTISINAETDCGTVNVNFIEFSSQTRADIIDEISLDCSDYQIIKIDKALATGSIGEVIINDPNASIEHKMGLLKICMDSIEDNKI